MTDTMNEDLSVYEVGYLIAGVPDEKVQNEAETLKKIIGEAKGSIIAEEAPRFQQLAYTIRRKTQSGAYDNHDSAHFGWVKFELESDKIEAVKKAIELLPSVLRMLLISTVSENTYLGKGAPVVVLAATPATTSTLSGALIEEKKDVAPASIEEMDKSIDNMVKEV